MIIALTIVLIINICLTFILIQKVRGLDSIIEGIIANQERQSDINIKQIDHNKLQEHWNQKIITELSKSIQLLKKK